MKSSTVSAAILAPLPSVLAQPVGSSTAPPNFFLESISTAADYNNLVLSSYHTGAGEGYAVLVTPSAQDSGIQWHLNGTASKETLTFTTTSDVPYSVIVPGETVAWEVNAGLGTKGFGVDDYQLKYNALGHFHACNNTGLPYGAAIQLFTLTPGSEELPLSGCEVVQLQAHYIISK